MPVAELQDDFATLQFQFATLRQHFAMMRAEIAEKNSLNATIRADILDLIQ